MKEYTVVFECGPSSYKPGTINWSAYVPDLPGCISAGDTREECERNIREAIELYLDSLREDGEPLPNASDVGRIAVGAA